MQLRVSSPWRHPQTVGKDVVYFWQPPGYLILLCLKFYTLLRMQSKKLFEDLLHAWFSKPQALRKLPLLFIQHAGKKNNSSFDFIRKICCCCLLELDIPAYNRLFLSQQAGFTWLAWKSPAGEVSRCSAPHDYFSLKVPLLTKYRVKNNPLGNPFESIKWHAPTPWLPTFICGRAMYLAYIMR